MATVASHLPTNSVEAVRRVRAMKVAVRKVVRFLPPLDTGKPAELLFLGSAGEPRLAEFQPGRSLPKIHDGWSDPAA